MRPHERLIELARSRVGIVEQGGNNRGPDIERMLRRFGGLPGMPWCVAFALDCVFDVDEELGTRSVLHPTLHALTMWNKTPREARAKRQRPGCVVVWQRFTPSGEQTTDGHVGIVVDATERRFRSVEGNTSGGAGSQRDGDGVFERSRGINGMSAAMRVKGFLDPWP